MTEQVDREQIETSNDEKKSLSLEEIKLEVLALQLEQLKKPASSKGLLKTIVNSPISLSVLGAIITAILALLNNALQSQSAIKQERRELESSLILRAMEEVEAVDREKTLLFLIDCGLVWDSKNKIRDTVAKGVPRVTSNSEDQISIQSKYTRAETKELVIQILYQEASRNSADESMLAKLSAGDETLTLEFDLKINSVRRGTLTFDLMDRFGEFFTITSLQETKTVKNIIDLVFKRITSQ